MGSRRWKLGAIHLLEVAIRDWNRVNYTCRWCLLGFALCVGRKAPNLSTESFMRRVIVSTLLACLVLTAAPAKSQVKMTREQMLFYTSDWKGDRFPDGRPRLPDELIKRAVDMSIEDVWEFLGAKGYNCQFEAGWQALHIEKPFAGRALTAQYMPTRPDMAKAIAAEGKAEGRVRGTNMWPINELQNGDVYVADGFGKIIEGTLMGSNRGTPAAANR